MMWQGRTNIPSHGGEGPESRYQRYRVDAENLVLIPRQGTQAQSSHVSYGGKGEIKSKNRMACPRVAG